MQYALLNEVLGRWKADVIESFLILEEIDMVLVQGRLQTYSQLRLPQLKFMFRKQALPEREIIEDV